MKGSRLLSAAVLVAAVGWTSACGSDTPTDPGGGGGGGAATLSVSQVTPSDGSTGVDPTTAVVVITFSAPVEASSVTTSSVSVAGVAIVLVESSPLAVAMFVYWPMPTPVLAV